MLSCSDDQDTVDQGGDQLLLEQQQTIETYVADQGITATQEGDIYYQVITANPDGEAPREGDIIRIYYQIAELGGSVIDELLPDSGAPPVTYVFDTRNLLLPALDFSIANMREGEEYEFYLPTAYSYLGYSLDNVIAEEVIIRARVQLVDIVSEAELRQDENERIREYMVENTLTDADSLSGGVYYVRTQEGAADSSSPVNGNTVQVRYTGTLLDGTEFDSNLNSDSPLSFVIGGNQVIDGFELGVSQMKPGEKATLIIPSLEAYAQSQLAIPQEIIRDLYQKGLLNSLIGSQIPPFSPLRFDIELITVN